MTATTPLSYTPITSATSAKILFDGFEIGELQDFVANETYNIKEVYSCGTNIPTLVPGFFSGNITSQKAFVDLNLFFTKLQPMSTGKVDSWLSTLKNALNLSADFLRDNLGTIGKLLESYGMGAITDSLLKVTENNLTQLNLFDIEIKDFFGTTINTYSDCVIDSRRISIATGHVVILENLNIRYRRRA